MTTWQLAAFVLAILIVCAQNIHHHELSERQQQVLSLIVAALAAYVILA